MFAQLKEKTVWTAIVRLGVFFFVFLGLEYLFDNLMAAVTDSTGVVRAQSYVLGVSAMGFLAYGMLPERIRNAGHRRYRVLLEGAAGVLCTVSIMIICLHKKLQCAAVKRLSFIFYAWHDRQCSTYGYGTAKAGRKRTCGACGNCLCAWHLLTVFRPPVFKR